MKKTKINLAHYGAMAGILSCSIPLSVQAQIIYTDPDPDIILDPDGSGSLPEFISEDEPIDMDDNGINDFTVHAGYVYYIPSSYSFMVKRNINNLVPIGLNAVAADEGTPDVFDPAHRFNPHQEIHAGLTWHDAVPFHEEAWLADIDLISGDIHVDDWLDKKYKFAGIRIKAGTSYKYGWIRLSVDGMGDGITIHDYALNNTPGEMITAGQTGLCYPPSISTVTNITATAARLNWAPVLGAASYKIRYRKTGTTAWQHKSATGSEMSKNISGLVCDADYEWQMRVECSDGSVSAFSALHDFSTASCRTGDPSGSDIAIQVYPNPADDHITISGIEDFPAFIELLNMQGQTVVMHSVPASGPVSIGTEELIPGLYLIHIHSGAEDITEQVIISRW